MTLLVVGGGGREHAIIKSLKKNPEVTQIFAAPGLNDEGKYLLYNEEIVKVGLAKIAYIFTQTKYLNRILSAQDEARAKKLNIWSIKGYVVNYSYDMKVVDNNSDIVYIKRDNSNKVYHKFKDIHNIKDIKGITLFEAKKLRYKPCKKCFKRG